jgi:heptosyltransferase I
LTTPRVLIVKTSSMGDVVHATAVVADILAAHPAAQIDWLVEAPFAAIPQMHPGVRRVLPMQWRKWRVQLWKAEVRQAMSALRDELRREPYDVVLDLQGLLKSALWARQAIGPVVGYDSGSAREGLSALFYQRKTAVPKDMHAVVRCRWLAAAHLGYTMPETPANFGLVPPKASWQPRDRHAVLIPNASRVEKLWPERHWVSVGKRMTELGWLPLVLWGRPDEQTLAERIAASCDGDVPPFLKVGEMAAVLASARMVVGLDTGFTHLAAALGRPTIGIYCDHDPGLAGITGSGPVDSIGGVGQVPSRQDVMALFERQAATLR